MPREIISRVCHLSVGKLVDPTHEAVALLILTLGNAGHRPVWMFGNNSEAGKTYTRIQSTKLGPTIDLKGVCEWTDKELCDSARVACRMWPRPSISWTTRAGYGSSGVSSSLEE